MMMSSNGADLFFIALGFASILVSIWILAVIAYVIRSIKPYRGEYQGDFFDR